MYSIIWESLFTCWKSFLWLWLACTLKKSLPKPLQRRGCAPTMCNSSSKLWLLFDYWRNYSNKHVNLHANYPLLWLPCASCVGKDIPSFGGAWGGFPFSYLSFCNTDSYNGICGTCYSSTQKNDCFLNEVAYLCKQKEKAYPLYSHTTYSLTPNPSPNGEGSE